VGSLQYVKFKCKELEELVVVPMTNEKAYEQVLARNLSSSSIKVPLHLPSVSVPVYTEFDTPITYSLTRTL
jgi:hypothetical protein